MGLDRFINLFFQVYFWLILAYVFMSFFQQFKYSQVWLTLGRIVEPYLSIFRRFIPPIGGVLDISPIIALYALSYIQFGLLTIVSIIGGIILRLSI